MKSKINELAQIIPGYTFRAAIETSLSGETLVLQAQDFTSNESIASTSTLKKVNLPAESRPVFLQENDIVIVARGYAEGSFKAAIYQSKDTNVIAVSTMFILRPNVANIDPHYLCYYLNTKEAQRQILEISSGSVIKAVSRVKFEKEIEIPCPSLEQQRKIVAMMQIIKEYTQALSKKITIINNISQSIITQMH